LKHFRRLGVFNTLSSYWMNLDHKQWSDVLTEIFHLFLSPSW